MATKIKLPGDESGIEAFAMIVGINGFTLMVSSYTGLSTAQFTRDVLIGGVNTVERHGGEVVGLMGDAFYALLPDVDSVIDSCIGVAIDVNKQSEYLDYLRQDLKISEYPEGIGVKIAVEHGWSDVANISTQAMGEQRLFVGNPVIYASRISRAGKGNRCLFGPAAAQLVRQNYELKGPYRIKGQKGESAYTYYRMDLSDIWIEGGTTNGGKWYLD